jgi:hypothetical protein
MTVENLLGGFGYNQAREPCDFSSDWHSADNLRLYNLEFFNRIFRKADVQQLGYEFGDRRSAYGQRRTFNFF